MNKRIELLAPAGSIESLKAAVNAGADAVYIGGLKFGARAYANNLDEETMKQAIDYVHLHGARLFMTVNTLLKDEEMETLVDYLAPYYAQGLDGVIIQDLGVFRTLQKAFPNLELHASTQMTLLGANGAKLLKEMGSCRIVPARELSLEEIKDIKKNVDIEVETFIHGALCYCYSGQCLLSSMIGGRSGNRGRCAQPCRLPYRTEGSKKGEEYILSPKDMCTIELIPDLIEAGIDSLKIEGRMKRPEYTAGVVSIYRKYIDLYYEKGRKACKVASEDMDLLLALYNRGGFSHGYYDTRGGRNMISLVRPNHFEDKSAAAQAEKRAYEQLLDRLNRQYVTAEKKEQIQGILSISEGNPSFLNLKYKNTEITVEGPVAERAVNAPMTEEKIRKQMEKTGGTPFAFSDLDIGISGNIFLPMQALNEFRRNALAELEAAYLAQYHREDETEDTTSKEAAAVKDYIADAQLPGIADRKIGVKTDKTFVDTPEISILLEDPKLLDLSLSYPEIDRIYLDFCRFFGGPRKTSRPDLTVSLKENVQAVRDFGKKCYIVLPEIFRKEESDYFHARYEEILSAELDGFLLRSLEELQFLKDHGYEGEILADQNLYTFSKASRDAVLNLGFDGLTVPAELNLQEMKIRGASEDEMVIYGYQKLMITANCIAKTTGACRKTPGFMTLTDRYKTDFKVRRACENCHNVIYNSTPLYLIDLKDELSALKLSKVRLNFSMESAGEAKRILDEAVRVWHFGKKPSEKPAKLTRGHLKRGVE